MSSSSASSTLMVSVALTSTLLALPAVAADGAAPTTRRDLRVSDLPKRGVRHPTIDEVVYMAALAAAPGRVHERSHGVTINEHDEVLVEIRPRPGTPLSAISDRMIEGFGGRVETRGRSALDAWIPRSRLIELADRSPAIGRIGRPTRARPALGAAVSGGVKATLADQLHARGITGEGVDIGVLDGGYWALDESAAAGELAEIVEDVDPAELLIDTLPAIDHGTNVTEIISDMAPGARLHLRQCGTLAECEVELEALKGVVDVISMSLSVDSNVSFFDGTGRLCELATELRELGIVWVAAAGNFASHYNEAYGRVYQFHFVDEDGDSLHEFEPGVEIAEVAPDGGGGSMFHLELSWDDFPATAEDYDLHLFELVGDMWVPLSSSTNLQSGAQLPYESIIEGNVSGEKTYGVAVERVNHTREDLKLRLRSWSGWLTRFQNEVSISEPGHCADVTAVGALTPPHDAEELLAWYSSIGPTNDGRFKPDIVGPTAVDTSIRVFHGTSAATPHVAGAIALYMEAANVPSVEARDLLLEDAIPMGAMPGGDNVFGRGRLELDPGLSECAPDETAPCESSCATVGEKQCIDGRWGGCDAPQEVCNGIDDDCDGLTDEDEVCPSVETSSGGSSDSGNGSSDSGGNGDGGSEVTGGIPADDADAEGTGCSCRAGSRPVDAGGAVAGALWLVFLWRQRRHPR